MPQTIPHVPESGNFIVAHPRSRFDYVLASDVVVDEGYQRSLNPDRVNDIANHLDIDAFNVVTLSHRSDGNLMCLDGQHRIAAVLMVHPQAVIPAFIYDGITPEEEARIFFVMNRHRLQPTPGDAFKARLMFNDPVAVNIKAITDNHDLILRYQGAGVLTFDEVQAFSELERLYKRGNLDDVLWIIGNAWQGNANAHKATYLRGISTFLDLFSPEFSHDHKGPRRRARLIDIMRTNGTDGIDSYAAFFRDKIRSRVDISIARALHGLFNRGLHRGPNSMMLPRWELDDLPESVEGD